MLSSSDSFYNHKIYSNISGMYNLVILRNIDILKYFKTIENTLFIDSRLKHRIKKISKREDIIANSAYLRKKYNYKKRKDKVAQNQGLSIYSFAIPSSKYFNKYNIPKYFYKIFQINNENICYKINNEKYTKPGLSSFKINCDVAFIDIKNTHLSIFLDSLKNKKNKIIVQFSTLTKPISSELLSKINKEKFNFTKCKKGKYTVLYFDVDSKSDIEYIRNEYDKTSFVVSKKICK
jgi:hypothetical protein